MYPDVFRLALRVPLPTAILEIANQFLLFRIHRDDRLLRRQCRRYTPVDVGELCIPIRMAITLAGLAVALQAELLLLQQFADDRVADLVAQGHQFALQAT